MIIFKTFSILIDVRGRWVWYPSIRMQNSRTFFPINNRISLSSYQSCFLIWLLNNYVTIRLQLYDSLVLKSEISWCCLIFLFMNDLYLLVLRVEVVIFHPKDKVISQRVQQSISFIGNICNLTHYHSTILCTVDYCFILNMAYLFSINIIKMSIL